MSQNNVGPYLSGKYKCFDQQCRIVYKAVIHKAPIENSNVIIEVIYVNSATHGLLVKKPRCTREERQFLKLEIMANNKKGVTNTVNKNIIIFITSKIVIYNFENCDSNDCNFY